MFQLELFPDTSMNPDNGQSPATQRGFTFIENRRCPPYIIDRVQELFDRGDVFDARAISQEFIVRTFQ